MFCNHFIHLFDICCGTGRILDYVKAHRVTLPMLGIPLERHSQLRQPPVRRPSSTFIGSGSLESFTLGTQFFLQIVLIHLSFIHMYPTIQKSLHMLLRMAEPSEAFRTYQGKKLMHKNMILRQCAWWLEFFQGREKRASFMPIPTWQNICFRRQIRLANFR